MVSVAQLIRVLACGVRGREFDSLQAPYKILIVDIPERSKGADCKSVIHWFESNCRLTYIIKSTKQVLII